MRGSTVVGTRARGRRLDRCEVLGQYPSAPAYGAFATERPRSKSLRSSNAPELASNGDRDSPIVSPREPSSPALCASLLATRDTMIGWATFTLLILGILALDLFVLRRRSHAIG